MVQFAAKDSVVSNSAALLSEAQGQEEVETTFPNVFEGLKDEANEEVESSIAPLK